MSEVSFSDASGSGSGHRLVVSAESIAAVMLKKDPGHTCQGRRVIVSVGKLLAS